MPSTVIPFERFRPFERYHQRRAVPPLVFVDMQEEQLAQSNDGSADPGSVLANCRALLSRARSEDWPVAFATAGQLENEQLRPSLHWIDGFTPRPSDMVFEPLAASCYTSSEFAEAMTAAGMQFVLAGFSGDGACLATLIDASAYGHRVGFIHDASASRPQSGQNALESHRAVVSIAGRYAALLTTQRWLETAQFIPFASELDNAHV